MDRNTFQMLTNNKQIFYNYMRNNILKVTSTGRSVWWLEEHKCPSCFLERQKGGFGDQQASVSGNIPEVVEVSNSEDSFQAYK